MKEKFLRVITVVAESSNRPDDNETGITNRFRNEALSIYEVHISQDFSA